MRVTIIKLGNVKQGRMKFRSGYRSIQLACADGQFAISCISLDNRCWTPLVVGQSFEGAQVLAYRPQDKSVRYIDDDSPVRACSGPPCKLTPKPRLRQQELAL